MSYLPLLSKNQIVANNLSGKGSMANAAVASRADVAGALAA